MTRFHAPHPDGGELLRFVDGELPPRKAAAVRSHLEACWSCRTQLEELQKGIGDYVRYHEALKGELPPPPRPWADLRSRMEAEDRAPAVVRRVRAANASRWWISAAAAVLLGCLAFYRFGMTPAASAAELLQKAVASESSLSGGTRHIRVRAGTRSFTRPAVYVREAGASEDSLSTLFASANYSWEAPLSARSYASWREQLSEKRDEVENVRDGGASLYRIRTTTPAGSLAEATITLRARDLTPVKGTFQFRGSDYVEITEAAEPDPEPPAPAYEIARATPPAAPEHVPSASPAAPGPSEELQALAALHRIGADLGEPIELTRRPDGLFVTGTGIDPARQEQLRASLAQVPQVRLRFQEPRPMSAEESGTALSVAVSPPAHSAEIENAVGGRVAFEKFSSRALDLSEAAITRAHALENLARRFPASEEARLSQNDLDQLAALRSGHARALAASASELAGMMGPALEALGAAAAPAQRETLAGSWQEATGQVFAAAQQADHLISVLLAGANTNLPPAQVPQHLAAALSRLQTLSAAYRNAYGRNVEGQP
ncbi:MAG: zf-HC2 domain-containing protein [Rhodospirillales bacterium]